MPSTAELTSADTMFDDIGSELNPDQGNCTSLPFLTTLHLQMTSFVLAEVDGIVELELMATHPCIRHLSVWPL